jgi:hypothetical protein
MIRSHLIWHCITLTASWRRVLLSLCLPPLGAGCPALPWHHSIAVTFVSEKDGTETTVRAPVGKHLLEVAHDNDIELEGERRLVLTVCR